MRKLVITTVILACMGIRDPQPARAGAFATELTQLLNHAQLVMGYLRQGQQLVNELNMYADMLRNVKNIPNQVFGSNTGGLERPCANCSGRGARSPIRSATSTCSSGTLSPVIERRLRHITSTTRPGRRPPLIRRSEPSVRLVCKDSSFRASRPSSTRFRGCQGMPTVECRR